jgi:Flp pilus assembly protein TadG
VKGERGSAAVELVLLTPALVVMLLFVVAVGRLAQAKGDVEAAARDAARAASIARGPDSARVDGEAAAQRRLDEGSVTCRTLDVAVPTDAFRPGGVVSANVTCVVDLGELTMLRIPGTRTVAATFAEPVDTYRAVEP